MNSQTPSIRRFHFVRVEDVSGVSGTGIVGEGCEMSNGKVVFTWLSNMGTVSVYDNMKTFVAIHGHEGNGSIEWLDPDPTEEQDKPKAKTTRKKAPKKS
jgi:hypothetical protein